MEHRAAAAPDEQCRAPGADPQRAAHGSGHRIDPVGVRPRSRAARDHLAQRAGGRSARAVTEPVLPGLAERLEIELPVRPEHARPRRGTVLAADDWPATVNRVFGVNAWRLGAHAEFVCVRESAPVAAMPAGMAFTDAAAVCDGVFLRSLLEAGLVLGVGQPGRTASGSRSVTE